MSEDLDPGLRRMFAATAEVPADEAFVAEVAAKTARARWGAVLGRALLGALLVAVVAGALALGLEARLSQAVGAITVLVTASPIGWAAGVALVLAGVVGVRTLAPLAALRRL